MPMLSRNLLVMDRFPQSQPCSSKEKFLRPKDRVLEVACQLFGRYGYEGTHIRQVCNLAGGNIPSVCYYFQDKHGLYEAVKAEARKRLSERSLPDAVAHNGSAPAEQLRTIIHSLFARLGGESSWIAHLAARELADESKPSLGTVCEAFRADISLLEAAIGAALGPEADRNTLRLLALDVLGQCIFYCAARRTIWRFLPRLDEGLLNDEPLVEHLARFALRGLSSGSPAWEQKASKHSPEQTP